MSVECTYLKSEITEKAQPSELQDRPGLFRYMEELGIIIAADQDPVGPFEQPQSETCAAVQDPVGPFEQPQSETCAAGQIP